MEGWGGTSGIGGFPPSGGASTSGNLLDAAAQEFHPTTVLAPYPQPQHHPLPPHQQQLYCPHPYPALPPLPPPPPQMAMLQPLPPMAMAMAVAPPQPPPTPVVDGPPSRAVALCLVPPHAQERDVAQAMAPFGAIRSVDASAVPSEGVATVHFFDLRAAELAVASVREQHMRQQTRLGHLYAHAAAAVPTPWTAAAAPTPTPMPAHQACWDWPHPNEDGRGLVLGQAVWAHFTTGADDGGGENRGSLVVLTPLPGVSVADLRHVFQAFGDLKDVRESAQRPSHKFVDFFDTRDAARALAELNGHDLFGRRLLIEFTRPSAPGPRRRGWYAPHHRPTAPTPPRFQQATTWRPSQSQQPTPSSSSSSCQPARESSTTPSGSVRARREGVVLLRRTLCKASSDRQSSSAKGGGGNAGTASHERKSKGGGGKQNVASAAATATATSPSSDPAAAASSGKQQQAQQKAGTGSWKGRKSGWEARFLFKEPEAAAGDAAGTQVAAAAEVDTRTTVMIRNIPNKYSQKLLLHMLDNHCIQSNERIAASGEEQPFSSYDFVYLPIDFNNKCNVGYGFVNLTSPEAAVRLYKAFHKQPWEVYNSRKICQVTYARVQGLEALKEHFKNSKFPCDSDEYLPVAFSPARDGKELTEPAPIVGRSPASGASSPPKSLVESVDLLGQELMPAPSSSADGASSTTTTSTHAHSEHGGCDDDDDDDEDIGLAGELRRLGYAD